jgi:hypothetical protein
MASRSSRQCDPPYRQPSFRRLFSRSIGRVEIDQRRQQPQQIPYVPVSSRVATRLAKFASITRALLINVDPTPCKLLMLE